MQLFAFDVELLHPGVVGKNACQFFQRHDDGWQLLPLFEQEVVLIDFGFEIPAQGVGGFCGGSAFVQPGQKLHHCLTFDQHWRGHGGQRQQHNQTSQPRIDAVQQQGRRLALGGGEQIKQREATDQGFFGDDGAHRDVPAGEGFKGLINAAARSGDKLDRQLAALEVPGGDAVSKINLGGAERRVLFHLELKHLAQIFFSGQRKRETFTQDAGRRQQQRNVMRASAGLVKRGAKGLALGSLWRLQGDVADAAQLTVVKAAKHHLSGIKAHKGEAFGGQARGAQFDRHHGGKLAKPPAQETAGKQLFFQLLQRLLIIFEGGCHHGFVNFRPSHYSAQGSEYRLRPK